MRLTLKSGREVELPDEITINPSTYLPTKTELEEEYSAEKDLSFPLSELGDTEDKQMRNLPRIVFH